MIRELEEQGVEEIHDAIYEQLANKLKEEKSEFSCKHFILDDDDQAITFRESNSLIRDGTTGLKLWPASMALADFILHNKDIFTGRSILELGSGATGFIGMVLIKSCQAEKAYLSDCHDAVLNNLIQNVTLNLQGYQTESLEKSLLVRQRLKVHEGPELGILHFPWEEVDKHEDELITVCQPNILLAADVVYDDSIFDALIKCLLKIFDLSGPSLSFYLSQTVRNPETYEKFCHLLNANSFAISEENINHPPIFNWQKSDEIKILRILRNEKLAQEN